MSYLSLEIFGGQREVKAHLKIVKYDVLDVVRRQPILQEQPQHQTYDFILINIASFQVESDLVKKTTNPA